LLLIYHQSWFIFAESVLPSLPAPIVSGQAGLGQG
jgi:hypothetical protein